MLDHRSFFVRERVAFLKFSDVYDILDPATQAQIGIAQEKAPGWVHVLRFLINKSFLPTTVTLYRGADPGVEGQRLFAIERGFSFLRKRINVVDAQGLVVGKLVSKVFSLGGAFFVQDAQGSQVAMVQGDWKGWNFTFKDNAGKELGKITKKWAGIGKELFTSADNYMISLEEGQSEKNTLLLLAAGLAIDTVFKENR